MEEDLLQYYEYLKIAASPDMFFNQLQKVHSEAIIEAPEQNKYQN